MTGSHEVTGSIPVGSTKKPLKEYLRGFLLFTLGQLAQVIIFLQWARVSGYVKYIFRRPPEPPQSKAPASESPPGSEPRSTTRLKNAPPAPQALECPNMDGCAMFPLLNLAGTLKTWKVRYCSNDYAQCERYKRTERGLPVAPDMMPNGVRLGDRKNRGK